MNILNTGNFYIQKDDGSYEKIFDGEIKTIEFEPEPLDIMNECRHIYTNINIQPSIVFKVEADSLSNNFINPTGPFELIQCNKIQKRKHHKTRISKKWAKKYGYHTIFEDVYEIKSFEPQDIDKEKFTYNCEIEFKERRVYWN